MPPEAALADVAEEIDKNLAEAAEGDAPEGDAPEAKESTPEAMRLATLVGWKDPKDWKGEQPPGGLKSAEEYLADLPEVNRAQRKTIERLSGQVTRIVAQVSKLDKVQQRQMDADLEADLEAAIEAGDKDGAKKILAAAKKSATPAEPEKPSALAAFEERNADWYGIDDEATAYTAALDAQYARAAGGVQDPEAHMRKVEAGVKKRFPELFGEKPEGERETGRRAPLVARNRSSGDRQRQNGQITVADLSPAQRRAVKEMGVSEADYVKNFNLLNKDA